MQKKVLITGAAGLVGGILREDWGDRYALRLTDIQPVADLAAHDVLAHVVLLLEGEHLADLGGALGSEAAGRGAVGEALDVLLALLHDDEVHDGEVVVHDAPAHALALPHPVAALTVARHAVLHEDAHALVLHHTLHHRETLLVGPPGDLEDVPGVLVSEQVTLELRGDLLVEQPLHRLVVLKLEGLLRATLGLRNVQLHFFLPFFILRRIGASDLKQG